MASRWNAVECHGILWDTENCHSLYGFHAISMAFKWNTMASRWNVVECHGIPWDTEVYINSQPDQVPWLPLNYVKSHFFHGLPWHPWLHGHQSKALGGFHGHGVRLLHGFHRKYLWNPWKLIESDHQ